MQVGMALPTMAPGYEGTTTIEWCRRLDDSPFASVSAGERLTFPNPDIHTTLAAAAALTERVEVFANVVVLPLHGAGLVAKQLLTLEQLAPGRLVVGVGVGGREEDFAAAPIAFGGRHARLDAGVAELQRLWDGAVPGGATAPIGPRPAAPLRLLSGAMGPKGLGRAARWAEGVTGFSIAGVAGEMAATFALADAAWSAAGRAEPPRKVTGCFFTLGPDAESLLRTAVAGYLAVFGRRFAEAMAAELTAHTPERLVAILDAAAAAGTDELVLVPMSTDLACLAEAADVVSAWRRGAPAS